MSKEDNEDFVNSTKFGSVIMLDLDGEVVC